MPANLSPGYKAAEVAFRQANAPKERLERLREMLRTIPKPRGPNTSRPISRPVSSSSPRSWPAAAKAPPLRAEPRSASRRSCPDCSARPTQCGQIHAARPVDPIPAEAGPLPVYHPVPPAGDGPLRGHQPPARRPSADHGAIHRALDHQLAAAGRCGPARRRCRGVRLRRPASRSPVRPCIRKITLVPEWSDGRRSQLRSRRKDSRIRSPSGCRPF